MFENRITPFGNLKRLLAALPMTNMHINPIPPSTGSNLYFIQAKLPIKEKS